MCVLFATFFTFVVIIHFWGSLPLTLLKNNPLDGAFKLTVFIYNLEKACCEKLNYS
jgi:hypothetical protein